MGKAAPARRTCFGVLFLNTDVVASETGLPRSTVLAGFNSGLLPGRKFGGGWYTTELWLAHWLGVPDIGADGAGTADDFLRLACRAKLRDRTQSPSAFLTRGDAPAGGRP